MHNIRKVKSVDLFPVIKEILDQGGKARITVTGMSMYPFLREGVDSVELACTSFLHIRRGDVVLILRDNGIYVLHRVLRKEKSCFFIVGDAQQWIEGPVRPNQLIAVATAVWRKNRHIECSSLLWRGASAIWLRVLPIRHIILRLCEKLRKTLIAKIHGGIW